MRYKYFYSYITKGHYGFGTADFKFKINRKTFWESIKILQEFIIKGNKGKLNLKKEDIVILNFKELK